MEDIFLTRLYSSGVLRYAENDSDIDFSMKLKYSAKGPNAIGAHSDRRIPIRQRILHPSMLGALDVSSSSSSDPILQKMAGVVPKIFRINFSNCGKFQISHPTAVDRRSSNRNGLYMVIMG